MRIIDLQMFAEGQEPATPKRRREARQKGQIARSPEIGTVVVLAAGLMVLQWSAGSIGQRIAVLSRTIFLGQTSVDWTIEGIHHLSWWTIQNLAIMLAPVFAIVLVAGVSSQLAQVGFYLGGSGLAPQFQRINPIEGFKRLFSKRAAVDWLKTFLKFLILSSVGYHFLTLGLELSQQSASLGLFEQIEISLRLLMRFIWLVLAIYLVLAAADYLYQRWELEQSLRMTKEEIKHELRQTEGDPMLRSRRREIQRDLVRQMMLHDVPKADVVITNPTHYAVALRYTEDMDAPRVIAKGRGWLAQKIKEIAHRHQVVIMEDRKLAQALYKSVEVGETIPEELYQAVAEVLAFVWQIKGREV